MYVCFFKAEITASNSSGNLAINLCTLFFCHPVPLPTSFPDFLPHISNAVENFSFPFDIVDFSLHPIWMLVYFWCDMDNEMRF
jgi:hypothetical protein